VKKKTISRGAPNQLVDKVRNLFRIWYASISVTEIISNRELIIEIEKMEQILTGRKIFV
jgi:hypothetical protein